MDFPEGAETRYRAAHAVMDSNEAPGDVGCLRRRRELLEKRGHW